MDIINRCFADILFTKVDKKEGYMIYAAAVVSSFGDGKKQYILLFVPEHLSILAQAHIYDLNWGNLQTRILKNGYTLKQQKWVPPKDIQPPMFSLIERSNDRSKYLSEINGIKMELILLNDPKKQSAIQYHSKMNLIACIATFRCVISILSPSPIPPAGGYTSNTSTAVHIDSSFEFIQ